VSYLCCDATEFRDAEGFDTIVSLETIEHVPNPAKMIANLADLLRSGGVLVASMPSTPTVDASPHHLHELPEVLPDGFSRLTVFWSSDAFGSERHGQRVQRSPPIRSQSRVSLASQGPIVLEFRQHPARSGVRAPPEMTSKFILVAALGSFFVRILLLPRKSMLRKGFLLAFVLVMVALVLNPEWSSAIAARVGVGRGVGLLFYLSQLALFFIAFVYYLKFKTASSDSRARSSSSRSRGAIAAKAAVIPTSVVSSK
jgi:hypothetical protein